MIDRLKQRFPSGHPSTSWRGFLFWAGCVLTLAFALLQPAASESLGFGALLVFWAAHVFSALILLELSQALLSRTPVSRWPTGFQLLCGGTLGAVLFAPVAWVLDGISGVSSQTDDLDEDTFAGLLGELSGSAGLLVLFWLALNSVRMLRLPEFALPEAPPSEPAFLQKVPAHLGREVISLQAEQHYTRVRTPVGDCLILHPFGDAVAQLDPALGQQVHRSYWAAYVHIVKLDRAGQGGVLQMSDGSSAKVSRTYFNALKARL